MSVRFPNPEAHEKTNVIGASQGEPDDSPSREHQVSIIQGTGTERDEPPRVTVTQCAPIISTLSRLRRLDIVRSGQGSAPLFAMRLGRPMWSNTITIHAGPRHGCVGQVRNLTVHKAQFPDIDAVPLRGCCENAVMMTSGRTIAPEIDKIGSIRMFIWAAKTLFHREFELLRTEVELFLLV